MTNTNLLEKIKSLPDSLQIEVEHYIEFLLDKYTASSPKEQNKVKKRDGFGILKGKIVMSDDFDQPLEDMKEYM